MAADQSVGFRGYCLLVGQPFVGTQIALRPTSTDGYYTLHFCHQQIGEVDLTTMRKKIKSR